MKKIIFYSILILCISNIGNSQNINTKTWQHMDTALLSAADKFLELEKNYGKTAVFVVKIISFNKNKGIFSISYILNDHEYSEVNASHYFYRQDKLFIIRTDCLESLFTSRSRFEKIDTKAKNRAKDILAGPNMIITGQFSPVVVFNYKRKKLNYVHYAHGFLAEDKYFYFNSLR